MKATSLVPFLLCAGLLVGCGRKDAREWTPADHDQPDPAMGQVTGRPAAPPASAPAAAPTPVASAPEPAAAGGAELWKRRCETCHGPGGKADGPRRPRGQMPDMTQPSWQSGRSDAALAAVILQGRGAMPSFELDPAALQAVIARIRSFRSK